MEKTKNIVYTIGANFLTFFMGIVSGFIIPKFLGVEEYGYIKLFTFYTSYVGLTHLGFLDGIYLKYGAFDYEDIPKKKFRGYFYFLLITQLIEFLLGIVLLKTITVPAEREIIIIFTLLNMILINITTFFVFIHQFTKRFKTLSINLVLNKLIYIISSLILIYLNILNYKGLIILQTIINLIILIIYIKMNKELVIGVFKLGIIEIKECVILIKEGFFILIGNFMSILMIGMDRIFIDKVYGLHEFAMYSFAYTLISLFFILLNSLNSVIYPYLTRMEKKEQGMMYEKIRLVLISLMGILMISYFIIKGIVINYLPEYKESLKIFVFLVPTVMYSAHINILILNYYKVLKKSKEYTKNNCVALIIALISNSLAVIIFDNFVWVAIATLISFIIWLLYSDIYFAKLLKIKYKKMMCVETLIIISFFVTSGMEAVKGISVYLILFTIIIYTVCYREMKNIFKKYIKIADDRDN